MKHGHLHDLIRSAALLMLVALFCMVRAVPRARAGGPPPLQGTDWAAVLAADPNLEPAACVPAPALAPRDPCIALTPYGAAPLHALSVTLSNAPVSGYARLDAAHVLYTAGGRGASAAIIPIDSATSAGTVGLLVYRNALPLPQLVAILAGTKLAAKVDRRTISVQLPWYFSFEANCCNIAFQRLDFRLDGGQVNEVAARFAAFRGGALHPITARELTVRGYYDALRLAIDERMAGNGDQAERLFRAAYAFYSADSQADLSYPAFRKLVGNVLRIDSLQTQPGPACDEASFTLTLDVQTPTGTQHLTDQGRRQLVLDAASPTGYALGSSAYVG